MRLRAILAGALCVVSLVGRAMADAPHDPDASHEPLRARGGDTSLDFGRNIASNTPGTVKVGPNHDFIGTTGDVYHFDDPDVASAEFIIDGQALHAYQMVLPRETLVSEDGGEIMVIDHWTATSNMTPSSNTVFHGHLGTGRPSRPTLGSDIVRIGGTLNVAANQPLGHYRGEVMARFAYE